MNTKSLQTLIIFIVLISWSHGSSDVRIVGGEEAGLTDAPWQVDIYYNCY